MVVTYKQFNPGNGSTPDKITIMGPKDFVDTIYKDMFDWIYWSYAGGAVLREIWGSSASAKVAIVHTPNRWAAETEDDLSTAEDERVNAWARNAFITNQGGSSVTGTGLGASSVISFDKTITVPASAVCAGNCRNLKFNQRKFVLFHELVHSMRHVTGKWHPSFIAVAAGLTDMEEAIAILITNILMSEKGDNELRKDHRSMDTVGADPRAYVADAGNKRLCEKVKADHPVLYQKIAALKQQYFPFNPFYAMDNP